MNFITGNKYKKYAHYIFDQNGLVDNPTCTTNILTFFIKTDYIHSFFNDNNIIKQSKFQLITHNSDYVIDESYVQYLQHDNLLQWYAQNVSYEHKKLIPIPIGIANEQWVHGDIETITKTIENEYSKKYLIYANFNVQTNLIQRSYCLKYIKPQYFEYNVSFKTYLRHLSQAYFSICPIGNGIDTHRIWESLYLKTIPIVENTYNILYLKKKYNLPIIIIDDWSQLELLEINEFIYNNLIKSFNPSILDIENIL